nr:right-handed parallel beta-helix repeat-containing protein [Akkermansiaceae bacterium]
MKGLLLICLLAAPPLRADVMVVHGPRELSAAIRQVKAGDTIRLAPGDYPGGNSLREIANVTLEALDPAKPPHFKGGAQAWHFVRCAGLTLRNLHVSGQTSNGINIDDGGKRGDFVSGITLENIHVSDVGPNGNFDAIKCSGLENLNIRNCNITGWGGQAIDLVGCRKVNIRDCRITGKAGFSQHTGPQFKGGCEDVVMENCHLVNAGERPIQAGGSTGLDYFRPPGATFEARRIVIRGNVIEGGTCACAFTGVDGVEFSGNKVIEPTKWIFRILQETRETGFAPCRNGVISNNEFIFHRSKVNTDINIGPGTAPETFRFTGNHWLATDAPERSKPQLPVEEVRGSYGVR